MSCPNRRLLSLYADDRLSQRDKESVTEHLKSCPECKRLYSELLRCDRLALSIPEIPFDGSFDRLQRLLVSRIPAKPFPIPRWGIAAASVIMLAAGTIWGLELSQPNLNLQNSDTSYIQLVSNQNDNTGLVYTLSEE